MPGTNITTNAKPARRWCFTIQGGIIPSHLLNTSSVTNNDQTQQDDAAAGAAAPQPLVATPLNEHHIRFGAGDGDGDGDDDDAIAQLGGLLQQPPDISITPANDTTAGAAANTTANNGLAAIALSLVDWIPPSFPNDTIRGLWYQYEIAPETNRVHIQGYMELHKPARIPKCKTALGCPGAHLEAANGTPEQCIAYVSKLDTRVPGTFPTTIGECNVAQGSRTDLAAAVADVKSGKRMRDVALQHPEEYVKYYRGMNALRSHVLASIANVRRPQLHVIVIWGAAGTGKTRWVFDTYGMEDVYMLTQPPNQNSIWYDGYESQKVLLIDDFYGWIPLGNLLHLLDIYPLQLNIKGGHVPALYDVVVITSNIAPDCFYKNIGMKESLQRRIHKIVHIEAGDDVASKVRDSPTLEFLPGVTPIYSSGTATTAAAYAPNFQP